MANLTLWQEMREIQSHSPVVPKEWILGRVCTSVNADELAELLSSPMTPDYVRMHALQRLQAVRISTRPICPACYDGAHGHCILQGCYCLCQWEVPNV
jgi:hypothetical protein